MSTLTISEPTVLSPGCGCWPAAYVPVPTTANVSVARCSECSEAVVLSCDIAPHLEEGDRLVWVQTTGLPEVLAYFTESLEGDES